MDSLSPAHLLMCAKAALYLKVANLHIICVVVRERIILLLLFLMQTQHYLQLLVHLSSINHRRL